MAGEIASFLLLAAVLAAAVLRPHGLPEAVVAVPAAMVVVAADIVTLDDVQAEVDRLLPVLAFLAAVFVLAHLCVREGLFEAAGHWLSRSSGGGSRLLLHVFALSVATTSVLSLDATVVLLTPVVLAAAGRLQVPAGAHLYATGHLANSGSLLLPMANLTNLLAIAASGLTLLHFAALMAFPLVVVLVVEYVVLRFYFRAELADPGVLDDESAPAVPTAALVVLGCTLAGFVGASFVDIEPFWVAIAGALALWVHAASRGLVELRPLVRAVDLPFLLFVLGLAVVVRAVVESGLGQWVIDQAPQSSSLLSLLAFAAFAAVLANLVNNLPALLILLGPAAAVGVAPVLAVLIGVNIGPNLTYPGSLATLLWRRVLGERGIHPRLGQFTVLGLLTVPLNIVLATCALWLSTRLFPLA
jgi:arsenical pump membrane protein